MGLSRSPDLTLGINVGIDLLGALPNIRESLQHPESEDRLAWLLFAVANTLKFITDRAAAMASGNLSNSNLANLYVLHYDDYLLAVMARTHEQIQIDLN
jgi:hypothetical protein